MHIVTSSRVGERAVVEPVFTPFIFNQTAESHVVEEFKVTEDLVVVRKEKFPCECFRGGVILMVAADKNTESTKYIHKMATGASLI